MNDEIALSPLSVRPAADAVVFALSGPVGAHVGIHYRVDDAGGRRYLHLAWHHDLRDEDALLGGNGDAESGLWVEPKLDRIALGDVRAAARLIARRREQGSEPYAFDAGGADYVADGRIQLSEGFGLTCATFVLKVFKRACVHLVDEPTWDTGRSAERVDEDRAAQERLVGYLSRHDTHHAKRVAAQVGCSRIRAEEVAAASGMSALPISYERTEPLGREVIEALAKLTAA